jgi:hypothetical protein
MKELASVTGDRDMSATETIVLPPHLVEERKDVIRRAILTP